MKRFELNDEDANWLVCQLEGLIHRYNNDELIFAAEQAERVLKQLDEQIENNYCPPTLSSPQLDSISQLAKQIIND